MTGPYPPGYGAGPAEPAMYPEPYPRQSFPPAGPAYPGGGQPGVQPYPDSAAPAYPGMLGPPVQYPRRRRWWVIAAAGIAVLLAAVLVTVVVVVARGGGGSSGGGAPTAAAARSAIQKYLDALSDGDDETVARNTLCGLYDAVKERRSDLALANLSSEAFRKQYSHVEVTSIDKLVVWSPHQSQALFTMKGTPARGAGRLPDNGEQQAIAQLLTQGDTILVCSYLLRSPGQF